MTDTEDKELLRKKSEKQIKTVVNIYKRQRERKKREIKKLYLRKENDLISSEELLEQLLDILKK